MMVYNPSTLTKERDMTTSFKDFVKGVESTATPDQQRLLDESRRRFAASPTR